MNNTVNFQKLGSKDHDEFKRLDTKRFKRKNFNTARRIKSERHENT